MTNKTYTITLNDGTTLNNVNTKHWPCYEYDGVLDKSTLENNISKVTISQNNGIKYVLTDKMLNQYMITSQNTTLFNFKGQYDFVNVLACQKYNITFAGSITLEDVVITKFPYYEYNAIIEKDILEDNLYEVIICQKNQKLHTFKNKKLVDYHVTNGHTLFQLCYQEEIEQEQKYDFVLADGTELKNVRMIMSPYYDYENFIEKNVLKDNLSVVTIKQGKDIPRAYRNQILCNYYIRNGHTLFQLREKTQEDIDKEIMAQFCYKIMTKQIPNIDDIPPSIKEQVIKLINTKNNI